MKEVRSNFVYMWLFLISITLVEPRNLYDELMNLPMNFIKRSIKDYNKWLILLFVIT